MSYFRFQGPEQSLTAFAQRAHEEMCLTNGDGHILAIVHGGDWWITDAEGRMFTLPDEIFRQLAVPTDSSAMYQLREDFAWKRKT